MTKQQIQQLFKLRYNQNNWKQFLGHAFTNARLLLTPEILTGINTDVATQAVRLGYIVLNEDGIERNIAVYEVTLVKGIVLEQNRVGLRNLLRKYWKDIDAAFIVYHHPENLNWRYTYVSELTGFDAEGELIKVKTEPKRYTYILGESESCRTAAERFAIIAKKGSKATLDDVKDAFSVEKLSKAFFEEYKEHYENFVEFLTGKRLVKSGSKWKEKQCGKPNPQLAYIFNGDEKEARDFNKKLLGRIVFLYFIQKKGWMDVPEKSKWGQGDPNFLWNYFDKCNNKDIFYSEYLNKLFFDTLNTQRKDDLIELIPGKKIRIPFLNGGLFEEDNKKYRDLIIPAELFENLFQFFNRYNFTIYEDDPNDHTVAVDPEMLGHIFENLLEDNKDKGAYYTPKEIVHYMCQESLIEYLCTALEIENEAKEKEAISALLKNKEIDKILIPEFDNINMALDNVKICDPAIGSGAFPMGLLKEIFTAKQTLYTFNHGSTEGFDASSVKLNIIQNSIYGVDIEKGAVDIARLRFWLSLVVDEEAPKALPNLDYKIVVGNSLVSKLGDDIIDIDWSLDEISHGLFGQDLVKQKSKLLKKISIEQKEFFNPDSDKKKLAADIRELKIDLLINQLQLMVKTQGFENQPTGHGKLIAKQTERYLEIVGWKQQIKKLKTLKAKPEIPLNFFDWKFDFPEVMNEQIVEKVGFDIVIGNPPYVDSENMIKTQPILRKFINKKYKTAQGNWDLYIPFHELALLILKSNGIKSIISPNKWLSIAYAKQLRATYINQLYKICNCENIKVFEAGVSPVISFFKKCNILSFQVDVVNNKFEFITGNLLTSKDVDENSLGILLSDSTEILLKLKKLKGRFNNFLTCENPFSTSEAYKLCDILLDNKKPNYKYFKLINTGTIDPFVSLWGRKQTTYLKSRYTYPIASLSNLKIYFPKRLIQIRSPKLIITGMRYLECFNDYNGEYIAGKSTLIIREILDNKFNLFCALLNSKLVSFYIKQSFSSLGIDGGVNFSKRIIENIPIPIIKKSQENIISRIVSDINKNNNTNQDTTKLEQQIDNMVYKLYNLDYDVVKVIDPEYKFTKQEYTEIQC